MSVQENPFIGYQGGRNQMISGFETARVDRGFTFAAPKDDNRMR